MSGIGKQRQARPDEALEEYNATASPLARLLRRDLICHADREGKLRDRPAVIKGTILPYDDCDVDELLRELHKIGELTRYEVDGERFIVMARWSSQSIHSNETKSVFPDIPGNYSVLPEKKSNVDTKGGKITPRNRSRNRNGSGSRNAGPVTPETQSVVDQWIASGKNPKDYTGSEERTHRSIGRHLEKHGTEQVLLAVDRIHQDTEDLTYIPHIANAFGEHDKIAPYYAEGWKPAPISGKVSRPKNNRPKPDNSFDGFRDKSKAYWDKLNVENATEGDDLPDFK